MDYQFGEVTATPEKPQVKTPTDFGATFGTQGDMMFGTAGSSQPPEVGSAAKFMFQPSERTEFSPEEVWTSTKIGAGIGGAAGAFTGGPVGAATGAVGGGVLGAISNVAEQLTRRAGYPESVAMAAGFAAGAGAGVLGEGVKSIAKKVTPSTMAYLHPAIRTAMGVAKKGEEPITIAERTVRENVFGKKPEFISTGFQKNFVDSQAALKETWYKQTGQMIPPDKEMGDVMKDVLINNIDTLSKQGKPFINTPHVSALGEDLDALVGRGLATKADVNYVAKILQNQKSANPRIQEKATQDILNLLQHGGSYYKGGAKQELSSATQDALKNRFGAYLTDLTGEDGFKAWNTVLRTQHIAKARDAIPSLLQRNIPINSDEFKYVVNNLRQAPSEAREELLQAVRSQIGNASTDQALSSPAKVQKAMMKEYNRLVPRLKETGLFSTRELDNIQTDILNTAVNIRKQQLKNLGLNVLRAAEIGGAGAGLGSVVGYTTQEEQ